eukprot:6763886-Pyramimonas_sp.AAC.1
MCIRDRPLTVQNVHHILPGGPFAPPVELTRTPLPGRGGARSASHKTARATRARRPRARASNTFKKPASPTRGHLHRYRLS